MAKTKKYESDRERDGESPRHKDRREFRQRADSLLGRLDEEELEALEDDDGFEYVPEPPRRKKR